VHEEKGRHRWRGAWEEDEEPVETTLEEGAASHTARESGGDANRYCGLAKPGPEKRRVDPFFGSQASMRTEASFGLAKAQNQTTKQAQGGSSRPGQELATQPNRPNVSAPRK